MRMNRILAWAGMTLPLLGTLGSMGCAEKKTRIWIDPPIGYETGDKNPRNLYYQMEDTQSGKKESLAIPLDQMPENLVVEDQKKHKAGSSDQDVTKADQMITRGKLPDATANSPTLSYLRGLQEVEDLYQKAQFNEAIVKITPLIEQYPKQARLFMMQGTLFRKIGEKQLAYQAYKRAHELDQANPAVEEAFLRVQEETGELQ